MTDVVHCPATRQEQILLPLADDALREFAQHLPPPADHIKIEGIARHEAALARPAWVAANGWLALGRSHWMQGEGLLSENLEPTLLLIYSRWVSGWHGGCLLASWLWRILQLPTPVASTPLLNVLVKDKLVHAWCAQWIPDSADDVDSILPTPGTSDIFSTPSCP